MFWRRLPPGRGCGDVGRFRSVRVRVRLSRPACPGGTVGTEMWEEGEGRRVVYRQVVGERIVVRNAVVELAGEGAKLRWWGGGCFGVSCCFWLRLLILRRWGLSALTLMKPKTLR